MADKARYYTFTFGAEETYKVPMTAEQLMLIARLAQALTLQRPNAAGELCSVKALDGTLVYRFTAR